MDETHIPHHIALIPDGNRRWAKQRLLVPWKGHEEGSHRLEEICDAAFQMGVEYLTFWAASEDNLQKRSPAEITALLFLMEQYLRRADVLEKFHRLEVRVRILGRWQELIENQELHKLLQEVQNQTAGYTKANFTILLGYDGQSEMVAALNHLSLTKQAVDAATLRAALWTADLPPVDLVIRTGGEPHWSAGFMMWHVANSQLYFTDCLWPDFTAHELQKAIADFGRRQRRLGA